MKPFGCWKVPNSISVSGVALDPRENRLFFGCSDGSLWESSLNSSREVKRLSESRDGIVELETVDGMLLVQRRSGKIEIMKEDRILNTLSCSSLTFCRSKIWNSRLLVFPSGENAISFVEFESLLELSNSTVEEIPLESASKIGMITCLEIAGENEVFVGTDAGFVVEISLLQKQILKSQRLANESIFCMQFTSNCLWFGGSYKALQNNQNISITLPSRGINALCASGNCIFIASWDCKMYTFQGGNLEKAKEFVTIPQYPINCLKVYESILCSSSLMQKQRELLITGSKNGIICTYEFVKEDYIAGI